MKAIIIEDEKPARDLLKVFLKDFPQIELVDECEDGFKGIKSIQKHNPDLVFLDIQMPKLTGFEVLELLETYPNIIFTTAYDQYALKAFEMNAVDYLLKPFSKDRFKSAIEKVVINEKSEDTEKKKVEGILNLVQEKEEEISRIVVKSGSKISVLPSDSISYIEAQDDYVMLYTKDSKHLKKATMKYYETNLDPNKFIRIHRSYIVNVDVIEKIELLEKESYILLLKDGNKLKVSRSGYRLLKERLHF